MTCGTSRSAATSSERRPVTIATVRYRSSEFDERVAGTVHGTRVLRARHDLGEGAVEVEHDPRDVRLRSQGVEVSST